MEYFSLLLIPVSLGEILSKLSVEDRTLRTFRRSLGFSQVIEKVCSPSIKLQKNKEREEL